MVGRRRIFSSPLSIQRPLSISDIIAADSAASIIADLQSPSLAQLLPLGRPSPACATPDHPSPTAAPVIISVPPTSRVSPSLLAPATAESAQEVSPATGPPTPSPLPEAYVFSADPGHFECHKCCNCHNNFWWYSHCFMCNRS